MSKRINRWRRIGVAVFHMKKGKCSLQLHSLCCCVFIFKCNFKSIAVRKRERVCWTILRLFFAPDTIYVYYEHVCVCMLENQCCSHMPMRQWEIFGTKVNERLNVTAWKHVSFSSLLKTHGIPKTEYFMLHRTLLKKTKK